MAQAQNSDQPRLPLSQVEQTAKKAIKGDKYAIRAFVDAVLESSLLKAAPQSVRDRITTAEAEYRQHNHPPIREAEFADAINRLVDDYKLAPHMKTNQAQVRRFRKLMTHMVPAAVSSTDTDEMSPTEAVLIGLQLGAQKLMNIDYSVSPDEWVRSVDRDEDHSPGWKRLEQKPKKKPRVINVVVSGINADILRALADPTQSESSEVTYATHLFLDSIGVRR